jgi:hypothetical protein
VIISEIVIFLLLFYYISFRYKYNIYQKVLKEKGEKSHIFHLIWKKTFHFWTFICPFFDFLILIWKKIKFVTEKNFKVRVQKKVFSFCEHNFFYFQFGRI